MHPRWCGHTVLSGPCTSHLGCRAQRNTQGGRGEPQPTAWGSQAAARLPCRLGSSLLVVQTTGYAHASRLASFPYRYPTRAGMQVVQPFLVLALRGAGVGRCTSGGHRQCNRLGCPDGIAIAPWWGCCCGLDTVVHGVPQLVAVPGTGTQTSLTITNSHGQDLRLRTKAGAYFVVAIVVAWFCGVTIFAPSG